MAGTKSNCELPQKKIKEVDEREDAWNHMLHLTFESQNEKKKKNPTASQPGKAEAL